jgi:hypothetical protein
MRSLLAIAVSITAFSCFLPIKAQADTYQVIILANDNFSRVYGIDGSGTAVLSYNGPGCASASGICYYTTADPTLLDTPPPIVDNGGPAGPGCPALPALNPPPVFYLCNNGHEAFGGSFTFPGGVMEHGVFDGPDPIADFIAGGFPASGGDNPALMNSSGDFVYDEGFYDVITEAIDLTSRQAAVTPEPGTLTLFATGALAAAAAIRRRWLR